MLAAGFGLALIPACDDSTGSSDDYSSTHIESINGNISSTHCDNFVLTIKFSSPVSPGYETVVIDGVTYTSDDYARTIIIDETGYYHQLNTFDPDITITGDDSDILKITVSGITDTETVPVKPYTDDSVSIHCEPK